MKRRIASLLCALLLAALLCGCGKSGSTLPPLGALAALPESRLSESLQGYSRDSLILGWGEPERSMDGGLGDIWDLDTERELTVLYDEYGKVFVTRVTRP
ncbi:MAG: hypothetical protein E7469_06820 [Ruminococcaceae bacterium]|nr:hypothetical protein [Oscillospiraceae bacterium]